MRRKLALLALSLAVASVFVWVAEAQQPTPASAKSPATVEEMLKVLRADLQASRADIISKNLTLTAAQAAKFWPLFDTYQKEQNAIMDQQIKSLQEYADSYERLDDAAALALINAHLDRDAKMTALRRSWLDEFQKVLPGRLAVRAMQIDRRLSLLHQLEFSSRIPLVH